MVNINELTLGQIREIAAAFPALFGKADAANGIYASMIGQYVIVRSRNEGVNAGYVEAADATGVILRDARRLWYHRPAVESESWYEGVANHGLAPDCKISAAVGRKVIVEEYSATVCSEKARQNIEGYKSHVQG